MQEEKQVLVIGGGPAGMMAAIAAKNAGAKVTLWEKNARLGRKLMITGKGRCNITNAGATEDFIRNMPGNGQFLYSCFHLFPNTALMEFVESIGVPLKIERGKRVFPQSDRAVDVVDAFAAYLKKIGVRVQYETSAIALLLTNGQCIGALDQNKKPFYGKVILAPGGMSYPATGSTGDGYRMAETVGHTVIPLKPSLVPLETAETWVVKLAGLGLKNARATALCGEKVLGEEFGELLFTHFGLSGPCILTLSKVICEALREGKKDVRIQINLKPALTPEQLDKRLQRDLAQFSRKCFLNGLDELLPQSLIPVAVALSGIDPLKRCHQITREERLAFGQLLQALPLSIRGARPIEEAIVTAGGVCVKEVQPKTMASKLIPNLYFAGEVLDIDGFTGGFNLQAAFSSGYAAGLAAAA